MKILKKFLLLLTLCLFIISGCNNVNQSDTANSSIPDDENNTTSISLNDNKEPNSLMSVWDESQATKIVMDILAKYNQWFGFPAISVGDEQWSESIDTTTLFHNVLGFHKLSLKRRELMVVSVYSNYVSNNCGVCSGVLSIFEFEKKNGWYLEEYDITSIHVEDGTLIHFYPISPDNYGIYFTSSSGAMGELIYHTSLLAFINENVSPILETTHFGDIYTDYSAVLKKHEREDGYFYLLIEETEKKGEISDPFSDETDEEYITPIITKTHYKFTGNKYEEFSPSDISSSLTSIERFIDINSINQRNEGVCSTCNGTGVQICKLCNGTGINNMEIECGCVRTYKTEIASGHKPSHAPKQWTCLTCEGTGENRR